MGSEGLTQRVFWNLLHGRPRGQALCYISGVSDKVSTPFRRNNPLQLKHLAPLFREPSPPPPRQPSQLARTRTMFRTLAWKGRLVRSNPNPCSCLVTGEGPDGSQGRLSPLNPQAKCLLLAQSACKGGHIAKDSPPEAPTLGS